jgi:hypothetical protein
MHICCWHHHMCCLSEFADVSPPSAPSVALVKREQMVRAAERRAVEAQKETPFTTPKKEIIHNSMQVRAENRRDARAARRRPTREASRRALTSTRAPVLSLLTARSGLCR